MPFMLEIFPVTAVYCFFFHFLLMPAIQLTHLTTHASYTQVLICQLTYIANILTNTFIVIIVCHVPSRAVFTVIGTGCVYTDFCIPITVCVILTFVNIYKIYADEC